MVKKCSVTHDNQRSSWEFSSPPEHQSELFFYQPYLYDRETVCARRRMGDSGGGGSVGASSDHDERGRKKKIIGIHVDSVIFNNNRLGSLFAQVMRSRCTRYQKIITMARIVLNCKVSSVWNMQ